MPALFQLKFDLGLEDLNPILAGEHTPRPDRQDAPALSDCMVIYHIRSGHGTLYSRGAEYSIGPGQAFLLLPGETTSFRADRDTPWEYAWIGFTGKLAGRFSALPPVFTLPEDALPHLHDLHNADGSIGFLLAADLFALCAKLLGPGHQERDFASLIAEHIDKNYMQKLSVENFALRFNMDRRYLSQQFKVKKGVSIRTYLTQVRVINAGRLLAEGYSTGEAASMCGFGNVSNFHKMFTDYYGMTPLQWRQKHSKP